ncbi:hypothetical protein AGMMS50293_05690 [Spirochaetia bacterium]|nr:hypothetical protein AGMMS50293_05690 [Spirochaetia bacterium]
MNRIISTMIIAFSLLGLGACGSTSNAIDAAHNSRNSLNWPGVYAGTIPAADGPGINVELTLNSNETYKISYQYIDRGNDVFTETGSFKWDNAGGKIMLDAREMPSYYQVGENRLIQLDMNGNKITGVLAANYELKKVSDL